jgi:MoaA/NifB/PqqE/SkfB family radical SAM enzyme
MQTSIPFQLVIELTNRCNLSCLHCLRANNSTNVPDLPLPLYDKLLREASSYRASHVSLTGGEPTLHPNFEALLELTTRYQYTYSIMTNGWTFEQVYPLLLRHRESLRTVCFSLDGATAHTHDTIRQRQGSYQKVLQACMVCHHQHIPFALSMVLHTLNANEIEPVLELASKLGASALFLGTAQLTQKLVTENLAFSPEERRSVWKTMLACEHNSSIPVYPTLDFFNENPCFPCRALQMSTLTVDYLGRARFCCQLSRNSDDHQPGQHDVLGSLEEFSVWELHRKMVRKVAAFQEDKITKVEQGQLTENEHFPCFYCAKYFGKLEWLRDFPESPWNCLDNSGNAGTHH